MIDLQQYRSTIGCFYWRVQNQSNICLNSPCNGALHALLVLGRVVEVGKLLYSHINIAPLVYYDVSMCYSNSLQMYHYLCFQLLLSGDVDQFPPDTEHVLSVVVKCLLGPYYVLSCSCIMRKDKGAG